MLERNYVPDWFWRQLTSNDIKWPLIYVIWRQITIVNWHQLTSNDVNWRQLTSIIVKNGKIHFAQIRACLRLKTVNFRVFSLFFKKYIKIEIQIAKIKFCQFQSTLIKLTAFDMSILINFDQIWSKTINILWSNSINFNQKRSIIVILIG